MVAVMFRNLNLINLRLLTKLKCPMQCTIVCFLSIGCVGASKVQSFLSSESFLQWALIVNWPILKKMFTQSLDT
jgi:hypothetical protein